MSGSAHGIGAGFDEGAEVGCDFAAVFRGAPPALEVPVECIVEFLELFQLFPGLAQSGFGDSEDASASLFALAAQGKNAFNFVQGEAEGLRLFDKAELFQGRLVVDPITGRGPFGGGQQPAPFVEANGVGLDAGQLCNLSNEQGLAHARARRFAWASLMRPSKTISPSTTTVGMARIP